MSKRTGCGIRDGQVEGGEGCERARRDGDVARVEAVFERLAGLGESRLGDSVVAREAVEDEADDVTVCRSNSLRGETQAGLAVHLADMNLTVGCKSTIEQRLSGRTHTTVTFWAAATAARASVEREVA